MALFESKVPPKTKTIKLGDYLVKCKWSNLILYNRFDAMIVADGLFWFKELYKGRVLTSMFKSTTIRGGTFNHRMQGMKIITIQFKKEVSRRLKIDILNEIISMYKKKYWSSGSWKNKHQIEPRDIMNLRIRVTSRDWP